jgi:predicted membrane protein
MNMMLTPNPTSAMAGFGYIYSAYAIVLILEILFIYRPTLVALKQRARGGMKLLYAILTMGSDNVSKEALDIDHKITAFLAAIGIPMACTLHGYVGFIFGGVKANPMWATPLMPVIFLLSASVSGIAGIILSYVIIRDKQGKPLDMQCVRTLIKFLWGCFILDFVFEMLELFSHAYMATHHWEALRDLYWGPLFWSFWVAQVGIFSLIPFVALGILSLVKLPDRIVKVWGSVIAAMILVQVLLMRWNVVIGGQLMSKSERGHAVFHPGFFTKEGIIPSIIIMLLPIVLLYLLGKVFPFWLEDDPTVGRQSA